MLARYEEVWRSGVIASRTLNVGTRWTVVSSTDPRKQPLVLDPWDNCRTAAKHLQISQFLLEEIYSIPSFKPCVILQNLDISYIYVKLNWCRHFIYHIDSADEMILYDFVISLQILKIKEKRKWKGVGDKNIELWRFPGCSRSSFWLWR
jgi:hypothetical protein